MKKLIPFILIFFLFGCSKQNEIPELIPFPKHIEMGKGNFNIDANTKIFISQDTLQFIADYLQKAIKKQTGIEIPFSDKKPGSDYILMDFDPSLDYDEYQLIIDKKSISITGKDARAVLLGIQTIRQLLYLSENNKLSCLQITDKPEWNYRGMMLDAARHFYTIDEIKDFLDIISLYKFNKFHWHLSDDQGWRIEIKKYPGLTEKSAWRTFNNHDLGCINLAEKDNNPDYLLPEFKLRKMDDTIKYGGYYTQQDIKEIVAYATERGIDIIPEIDMPGHFSAAIKVFPELACFDEASWGSLFSAPICPGKESTFTFCKNVFEEIFELFPYEYVHIGADEVEQSYWEKCPHCQKRISENHLKDEHELHSWFIREMEKFFTENGKKLIGWDEIADGGLSKSATMMWWRTWVKKNVIKAIEQGNQVILTPNSHYYFDYQQNKNTLKELYEFDPVPDNINNDQRKLIKGIQANLWAEYIPSVKRMQYMVFPRLLALSETAWNYNERSDWENFKTRLIRQYSILDELKINYRPLDLENIEQINVFIDSTSVEWNNPLHEVKIRYTTDGSIPDENANLYTAPIKIYNTTDFTIRYFRPDGTSADIFKTIYKKEVYREGVNVDDLKEGIKLDWHEIIAHKVSDIESEPVKKTYIVNGIDIPEDVGGKRGLIYTGYLNIPEEDIYTFVLASDDGSKLYIHDEVVVDNDKAHGPITVSGQIALQKGLHPIKLYYFDMNNGGILDLKYFNSAKTELQLSGNFFNK